MEYEDNLSYLDLERYFSDEINNLNNESGKLLSQVSLLYIIGLLKAGLSTNIMFDNGSKKYICDMYQDCLSANSKKEKYIKYTEIGDYSLFTLGLYVESLNNGVDIKYYIDMGSSAYKSAFDLSKNSVFYDLYYNYECCINLLNEFSVRSISDRNGDMIKLYNIWLKTNNIYTERKLIKLGLLTRGTNKDEI